MNDMCRFCKIAYGLSQKPEDQPIIESDTFFSIASIGALVEGWILLVPKMHSCSMKDLFASSDFVEFANKNIELLQNKYDSQIITFEHGPNRMNSATSCGTNHAHLHLVPFKESLIESIKSSGLHWARCHASEINTKVGNNEYLFYSEIDNNHSWENPYGYLHILTEPISQYFRIIIAQKLECIDEYNYKTHPNIEKAIKTQMDLTAFVLKA